jgi:hypothetical protein
MGTDANVLTTKARSMVYLPFPLVAGLLGSNLTARQAYELLIPELMNAGMMTVCEPLVYFLTVILLRPSAERTTPLTVQEHLWEVGLRARHGCYQPSARARPLPGLARPPPPRWVVPPATPRC